MSEASLPDAEMDVMASLWKSGPATAREVREALAKRRPLAHSSVCTLLKRLEAKGLVARHKAKTGKAFVYSAAVQPTGTSRRLLSDLLDRMFGGSGVALVASLLETRPPSHDELDQLEALLNELRQNQRRSERPRRKRRK
ncbi:MAG: BlaI/MecI/CopY family transcriptional regulator [Pirellulales bacterium]